MNNTNYEKNTYKIYKCDKCNKVIEILNDSQSNVICCNEKMRLLIEKCELDNKHVPFIEYKQDKYIVTVGKNEKHPMNNDHYIEWIELYVDNVIYRKILKPNQEPIAEFKIKKGNHVKARAYCNIHELWISNK